MTLTSNVPDRNGAALQARAQAQGVSAEQYVEQVLEHDLEQPLSPVATSQRSHIAEVVREIFRDIPAEDWETMPTDGASEHDHYLYGCPKRNP